MVLRHNEFGEYRVNFQRGPESTAYYTNDLDDAVTTGKDMMRRRLLRAGWTPEAIDADFSRTTP